MDFGAGDLGFIWENDPAKRKAVAKKILPRFSTKALKSMEPTVHSYMDLFISKELGSEPEGILMNDVGVDQPTPIRRTHSNLVPQVGSLVVCGYSC